jgi:hypothetical protein
VSRDRRWARPLDPRSYSPLYGYRVRRSTAVIHADQFARKHPGSGAYRGAAIDALTRLHSDAGSAKKEFSSYREVRVDLGAWQSVLALEVRSLATPSKARAARTSQLDARARAAQTTALRAIARLQHQLQPL